MKQYLLILAATMAACSPSVKSTHVWLTAESGEKCAEQKAIVFHKGTAPNAIVINREEQRQMIDGFGGSLTESSAFVLACLTQEQREVILKELYGEDGANFTVSRTQIGASDFSVEGNYSLAEQDGDTELLSFSLDRDMEGFPKDKYPQVKDESYDLFQLMLDVWNIKQSQADKTYRIIASPWTAPAWMKDNGMYYQRDEHARRGGALLPKYYQTYADYFVKYLDAYSQVGLSFWAVTPENEPMGNDGGWESMDLPPDAEAEFIGKYLGPTLGAEGYEEVRILGFDQNTFEMSPYTAAIYGNPLANRYCSGMAIHWYGSTVSCFPQVLDSIHALYPDKTLFHTEGCIDNLGCDPWPGVSDFAGFKESGWFNNDAFWWNNCATDWAYSTPFWPDWHPAYAPVHRYAGYIIDGLNHWMTGFCDWNIVLDSIGGPNHVNNFAAAQVMVDYQNDIVYFTPYYYALKQFSRSMRPGDIVLGITEPQDPDLHICAVQKPQGTIAINALNQSKQPKTLTLQIEDYMADITLPANSVETIIVEL